MSIRRAITIAVATLAALLLFASSAVAAPEAPSILSGPNVLGYQLGAEVAGFNGSFNPNGSSTDCSYEVASDAAYLPGDPDPYADAEIIGSCNPGGTPATGTSPVSYGLVVTDLTPLTGYHIRVTLTNSGGAASSETTFSTLWNVPQISDVQVSDVTSDAATIRATIDTNGMETRVHVNYGAGSSTSSTPTITLTGGGVQFVSIPLSGLSSDSVVEYTLVAENRAPSPNPNTTSAGFENSFGGSFKTSAPAPPAVEPQVGIIAGPKPNSSSSSASFSFNKSSSVARTECQVDDQILDGQWVPCDTGYTVSVGPGDHQFNVRGFNAAGKASQVATYYWTTVMPSSCQVETLRARAFIYTGQNYVRMVQRYTAYRKIKNVKAQFFVLGGKQRTLIGTTETDFKKAGVLRIKKAVNDKLAKQVRKSKKFLVQLRVPNVSATCTKSFRRTLDVERRGDGYRVIFQHDLLFNPAFARG